MEWIILDIGYTYPPTSPEENMGRESICFIMFYLIQTFEGRDRETEKEKNWRLWPTLTISWSKSLAPKNAWFQTFQIHVLMNMAISILGVLTMTRAKEIPFFGEIPAFGWWDSYVGQFNRWFSILSNAIIIAANPHWLNPNLCMCKSLFSATFIIKNPNVGEFKPIKNPMKAPIFLMVKIMLPSGNQK